MEKDLTNYIYLFQVLRTIEQSRSEIHFEIIEHLLGGVSNLSPYIIVSRAVNPQGIN